MRRSNQLIIAGLGATAIGYGVKRVLGRKSINTLPWGYGTKLKKSVTVNRSAEELYNHWRNLENIPKFIGDIVSVKIIDDDRSHWTLKVPGGMDLEWDAVITVNRKNEMIGWRSITGADIDNAGYVRFDRATGGRGTVVRVALQYNPPGGKFGAALSTLLGEKPGAQVEKALRRFKQLMEAGEIPTTERVQVASEESFPASDAPGWTGTLGPQG
jgi:uncharacterized membrane protein